MTRRTYTRLRRSLGMTQVQLAKLLGENRVTVAKRESGAKPITRRAESHLETLVSAIRRVERGPR